MPASYEIDPDRRLVTCRVWGVLTGPELIAHYHALRADPAFDSGYRQLADLTEARQLTATADELRAAATMNAFAPGARRAIIAPTDIAYGMARMFAVFAEGDEQQIEVFRDARGATDWVTW